MRKLFILTLFLLALCGCHKHTIVQTYFGDINLDTAQVFPVGDGSACYIVKMNYVDSVVSKAMNADTMLQVTFYSPASDTYYMQLFGNDGSYGEKIPFDPTKEEYDLSDVRKYLK